MLVLCDEHIHAKNRLFCHGSLRWVSLRHHTFGGVTHFQAMLGTNIPNFVPVRTTLRRTLRHVLEHSIKPRWAPAPSGDTSPTPLRLEDRLHPVTKIVRSFIILTILLLGGESAAFHRTKWASLLDGQLGRAKVLPVYSPHFRVSRFKSWMDVCRVFLAAAPGLIL
jgi:hypothetical protein